MGKKIAFVTVDWSYDPATNSKVPNGSSFYRCYLPMLVLPGSHMGMPRFDFKKGIGLEDDRDGLFGFDVAVVKLIMDKKFVKWVEKAKELGQRIVVDVDDYYQGLHEANAAYRNTSVEADASRNREWMERITLAADTIITSTPFLRDVYAERHPDVRVVRNAILPQQFPEQRLQENTPLIGWMGHTAFRSGDLETLTSWLPDYLTEHHLKFRHSGYTEAAPGAWELIGLDMEQVENPHSLVPMNRLHKLMCFDIGLAPLSDIPFNYAKSGLKFLEMAAAGIPCVGSALPEYTLLAEEGIGKVARNDEEWIDAVTSLLGQKTRVQVAEQTRAAVMANHTIQARAEEWRAAIEGE